MKYCTYILKDPNGGIPFYVGSGKLSRPLDHFKPNLRDNNLRKLDKIGKLCEDYNIEDIIEIVEESDCRDEMFSLEQSLIDLHKTIEDGGILLNIAKFVEGGMSGRKHSDYAITKMVEAHKGKNNPFFGKKHSEETKLKMSESGKGKHSKKLSEEHKRKISDNHVGMKGKKFSAEAKRKMSEAKKGKKRGKYKK